MIKKILVVIAIVSISFSFKIIFFSKNDCSNTGITFNLNKQELIFYKEKAYKGNINAIIRLDEFYSLSKNNTKEGLKWLILAIKLYNIDALNNYMASLSIEDKDGKITNLIKWLTKQAQSDNAYAQRELYHIYSNGRFIEQDLIKSKYWLNKLQKNLETHTLD